MGPTYWYHDLDLSGSRDVSCHVTSWFPRCHFLWVLHCNRVSISNHFRDNGHFYIWVTTLAFLGHVTSSVTWPIDPPHVFSYWSPIVTEPLSLTVFEIFASKYIWVTILTFLGHVKSSVTWPIDPQYVFSYWCPIVTEPLSLIAFEIFGPQIPCAHTDRQTDRNTHRHTPQVILYSVPCNVLHWTDNNLAS